MRPRHHSTRQISRSGLIRKFNRIRLNPHVTTIHRRPLLLLSVQPRHLLSKFQRVLLQALLELLDLVLVLGDFIAGLAQPLLALALGGEHGEALRLCGVDGRRLDLRPQRLHRFAELRALGRDLVDRALQRDAAVLLAQQVRRRRELQRLVLALHVLELRLPLQRRGLDLDHAVGLVDAELAVRLVELLAQEIDRLALPLVDAAGAVRRGERALGRARRLVAVRGVLLVAEDLGAVGVVAVMVRVDDGAAVGLALEDGVEERLLALLAQARERLVDALLDRDWIGNAERGEHLRDEALQLVVVQLIKALEVLGLLRLVLVNFGQKSAPSFRRRAFAETPRAPAGALRPL